MTSTLDNPRRFQARLKSRPFAISTYEHLERLVPVKEKAGWRPYVLRKRRGEEGGRGKDNGLGKSGGFGKEGEEEGESESESEDREGANRVGSTGRVWRTRRRRDGKMFLATEYIDRFGIMDDARETLLRLLNHPNLVSLVDVVQDTNVGLNAVDYTVWEDCVGGTLNRLLWRENEEEEDPVELPESLCWHVLDGISQALLWLHHGHKHTFPFNHHMEHDDDWHPVLISEITPANIYFGAREGEETYGDVKLGNFRSVAVNSTKLFMGALKPSWVPQYGPYTAPEIRRNLSGLSDASEIWSLGAVIYHMMAGLPPLPLDLTDVTGEPNKSDFWVRSLPHRYSKELRDIVMGMLRTDRQARPTADDLSYVVGAGWTTWLEDTEEGQRVVLKGGQKRKDGASKSQIEGLTPELLEAGRLDNI